MSTQYVTEAKLTARLSSEGLAKIASPIWTLDTDATTRIAEACDDTNGQVDGEVAGLGLTLSPVPEALEGIAAKIAIALIFAKTWNPRGVPTPTQIVEDAKSAFEELDAMKSGKSRPDGGTPAVQVVGRFSYQNLGDNPASNNPRQTLRARMKGLP